MMSQRLAREVTLMAVLKLLLLTTIYFAFFSPAHREQVGVAEITSRLLSATPPQPSK